MWITFPRLVVALSPLPLLIACASGGAMGGDPNVITEPQLARTQAANTYQAIRQIRPDMLRTRQPGSLMLFAASKPAVAVDNTLVGGVEVLRTIPIHQVARIEYVSAWKASKRYGLGFRDGVVLVVKRTGSEPELASSDSTGVPLAQ